MIRNLFASTAIAALLATGALAQTTTTPPAEPAPSATTPAPEAAPAAPEAAQAQADGMLATNMIGETVYNGTGDDAENIGDVNDILIDNNGMAQSIIIGVGGFLGMGEKDVAVDFKEISWAERDGDRWIVVAATKEQLEALPDFDRTPYDPAPAVTASEPADTTTETTAATPPAATTETDTTAAAPADNNAAVPADKPADTAAAPADDAGKTDTMAAAPADNNAAPADKPADTAAAPADNNAAATDPAATAAIDKTTLTEMPAAEIRAEDLIGTAVYGTDDAHIGEIGDVVLTTDQKIDAIIIDVGGFLGVGEKEVAVGMDKLQFMRDADNNRYLYTTFTKEQLDAAPAYDESTFAQNRDQQLLRVQ